MGPVIRLEFVHEVSDVEINRGLSNIQLIRDLLIAVAVSNKPQNLEFSSGRLVVAEKFGQAGCYLWRDVPSAKVNRADDT
jgi:hypothetical protein